MSHAPTAANGHHHTADPAKIEDIEGHIIGILNTLSDTIERYMQTREKVWRNLPVSNSGDWEKIQALEKQFWAAIEERDRRRI